MRHRWFSNITAQRTLKPNTAPGGFTNPILIPGRRCENQRHDLLILLPLEWNLHGSASSEMEQFLTMPRLVIGIPLTFPWSPFTGNVIIIAKTHIYSIHNLAKMRKGCEASHLRIELKPGNLCLQMIQTWQMNWMNKLPQWLFTPGRCGSKQTGLSSQLGSRNAASRISNCGDPIPVTHCFQSRKSTHLPDQWRRGGFVMCLCRSTCYVDPLITTLCACFGDQMARWGSLHGRSSYWLFVYVNQEVLRGLAHPSWTNNCRNFRNAVRTMWLLFELISSHSVNFFL